MDPYTPGRPVTVPTSRSRDDREWLTPEECAERLGRPVAQVLVMVAAGALRSRRLGDELLVEPAVVNWPAA